MRYEIIGKDDFVPTEAIKTYIQKKLNKITNFFDVNAIDNVRVVLRVFKDYSKVEVTIPAPYIVLRSEVRDPDMYAAIDKTVDVLSHQIKKHRSKIRHNFERSGKTPVFNPEFDAEALDKEFKAANLVKSKKIAIKELSTEDAIAAMELSGHDFFIFLDIKTKDPKIVYRRQDGDYAVIHATPEQLNLPE